MLCTFVRKFKRKFLTFFIAVKSWWTKFCRKSWYSWQASDFKLIFLQLYQLQFPIKVSVHLLLFKTDSPLRLKVVFSFILASNCWLSETWKKVKAIRIHLIFQTHISPEPEVLFSLKTVKMEIFTKLEYKSVELSFVSVFASEAWTSEDFDKGCFFWFICKFEHMFLHLHSLDFVDQVPNWSMKFLGRKMEWEIFLTRTSQTWLFDCFQLLFLILCCLLFCLTLFLWTIFPFTVNSRWS